MPKAKVIGFLVNPTDPNVATDTEQAPEESDERAGGDKNRSSRMPAGESDLEPAFAKFALEKVEAIIRAGKVPFTT